MASVFHCPKCKQHFNFGQKYPLIPNGQSICRACFANEGGVEEYPDDQYIFRLKEELLDLNCHPAVCHPDGNHPFPYKTCHLDVDFFDEETCRGFCAKCATRKPSFTSLAKIGAKDIFRGILRKAITQDYPMDYIEEFKGKYNNVSYSAMELLNCIQKKFCYDSDEPLCYTHLRPADYIDAKTFLFKCESCYGSNCQSLNKQSNYIDHLRQAINICYESKTPAFNSTVLKVIKQKEFPKEKSAKNFLLEMGKVISAQNDLFSANSRCLNCEKIFNVGEMTPIKLHPPNNLHEICYKCFTGSTTRKCPIENYNFPDMPEPYEYELLYKFRGRVCVLDHSDCVDKTGRFTYINGKLPYKLPCNDIICSEHYSTVLQTNVILCRCGKEADYAYIKENQELKDQLKYLEMECTSHKGNTAQYYNNDLLIAYCAKCNFDQKYKHKIDPFAFNVKIIRELGEMSVAWPNPVIERFMQKHFLYTLSVKLKMHRYMHKNLEGVEDLLIYDKILPQNSSSIEYWTPKATPEKLNITATVVIVVFGIIIGRSLFGRSRIRVLRDSIILTEADVDEVSEDFSVKTQIVKFPDPVLIENSLDLEILFSEGGYFHGFSQKEGKIITPGSKKSLDHSHSIKFASSSTHNGLFANGGPVLGLYMPLWYIFKT